MAYGRCGVSRVYGPDYVDEFIVQTYNDGLGNQQPLFMLQDGNP